MRAGGYVRHVFDKQDWQVGPFSWQLPNDPVRQNLLNLFFNVLKINLWLLLMNPTNWQFRMELIELLLAIGMVSFFSLPMFPSNVKSINFAKLLRYTSLTWYKAWTSHNCRFYMQHKGTSHQKYQYTICVVAEDHNSGLQVNVKNV